MIYSSSLRTSLPGNRSSKSLMCVVTQGLSLSSTLNLIDPFDTQKESMSLLVNSFLHFRLRILLYRQRLPLINSGEEMLSEVKSIPIKFFLQCRILFVSFRFENLIITRLGPLLGNQRQSSIFEESVLTSSFLKIFNAIYKNDYQQINSVAKTSN